MKQVLVISIVTALVAFPAIAQERGEGRGFRGGGQFQQLSEDEAQAAWVLQARTVSEALGLEQETGKKLGAAYVEVRKEQTKAFAAIREEMMEQFQRQRDEGGGAGGGGGGGGRGGGGRGGGAFGGMRERMNELNATHRENLSKALAEILDEKSMKTAVLTLGSFNTQWDRMVHTVAGFELDEIAEFVVLGDILAYVTTSIKARESGDPESMREAMTDAGDKLRTAVEKALTSEQLEQFNRTLRRRGGRGGFGGGGGGRIID